VYVQVVDAVAYLHSLGIMHRDIKPENCLLAKPAQHYAAKGKPVKVRLGDVAATGERSLWKLDLSQQGLIVLLRRGQNAPPAKWCLHPCCKLQLLVLC
jgi:serine/threonine protein kinase